MRLLTVLLASAVALLTLTENARAEPSRAEDEARVAEPGSSPVKRGKFHAGVGLGPGLMFARSGAPDDRRSFSGGSASFGVLVGGRVSRRLVFGGTYLRDQIFALSSKDEKIDGDEPDLSGISFVYNAIGVGCNAYLQDRGGPHLDLVLSYGFLDVRGRSSSVADEPSGVLFSGGLGYDFLVSADVSLGLLLRIDWAQFDVREQNGTDVNAVLPSLLFTATLN